MPREKSIDIDNEMEFNLAELSIKHEKNKNNQFFSCYLTKIFFLTIKNLRFRPVFNVCANPCA